MVNLIFFLAKTIIGKRRRCKERIYQKQMKLAGNNCRKMSEKDWKNLAQMWMGGKMVMGGSTRTVASGIFIRLNSSSRPSFQRICRPLCGGKKFLNLWSISQTLNNLEVE